MKQTGVLLLGCLLTVATGLRADTWWQAQLDQVEAFNRQTAASREAMWAANPGWKGFKTVNQPLESDVESTAVRVKMAGIRKVWLGSVGRGQAFCDEQHRRHHRQRHTTTRQLHRCLRPPDSR